MKVGIFYSSISNPGKFSNKVMLMDNFARGVKKHNDEVINYSDNSLPQNNLNVGFVLGYTLEDNFRKKIINALRASETPQVFVDSNILHYARKEHEWHRYSLNSVYPNDGVYFFRDLDTNKWDHYSAWHNTTMKPWRNEGNHIVIFAQRPKGWNMFGNDQDKWLNRAIEKIMTITDRPVVVRMHPGDGARQKQIDKLQKTFGNKILVSDKDNIRDDLKNCWATVGYNSTPNVVAAIEGVPCYVEDPVHSWAADVAFTDLKKLVNPPLVDRESWIHKIANIHWSNEEVRRGDLWEAIKYYISSSR
jgi:hypothetical protein